MVKLTIFTPTYNRATLLPRLYQSLTAQVEQDFEWLIIDDGSSDDTESVVASFIADQKLDIRYLKKENGGKHTAHNMAVQEAKGEYFFCVDSDDWLADDALTKIMAGLMHMKEMDYALMGYKVLENRELICKPFPDINHHIGFYQMGRLGVGGEYAIVMRTSILRKYPFPVIQGERFSTEAVLYDRLELDGYTVCPLNAILTICEYQNNGLSSNAYRLLEQSPTAYQIYHMQRIDLVHGLKERIRHATQYQAFCQLSGNRSYRYQGTHKCCVGFAYILGVAGALYYKKKFNSIRKNDTCV